MMEERIEQYKEGLISKAELAAILDELQIYGDVQSNGRWVGYNYITQQWLVV